MSFQIIEAATVICLRRRLPNTPLRRSSIAREEIFNAGPEKDKDSSWLNALFQWHKGKIVFKSEWEVLMGQSEVKNWFKSSQTKDVMMRYGGEYKFAGGTRDLSDATLAETARRELSQEFLVDVPESAKLHLFNVKQTKPIRGKSYLMHNFVALLEENEWLQQMDVPKINGELAARRKVFHEDLLETGQIWSLTNEEKTDVCPEVYRLDWLPIAEAVFVTMTSKSDHFQAVNDWQRQEFLRYGIKKRDPMFQTMATLFEVDECRSEKALIDRAQQLPELYVLQKKVKSSFMRNSKSFALEDASRIASEKQRRRQQKKLKQEETVLNNAGMSKL